MKRLYEVNGNFVFCRDADLPGILCKRGVGPVLNPHRISDWNRWLRQKAEEAQREIRRKTDDLWLQHACR